MIIRLAKSNDAEQIQRLYKMLVPNDNNICVMPERIDEILNSGTNFLYIAETDNKEIVGTIFFTLCLDPMYKFSVYAVIENIIIDSLFQNMGIGKMLMNKVENECRKKNCTKIMLLSSSKRLLAHKFFGSLGYSRNIKVGFIKYLNRKSAQQGDAPEPAKRHNLETTNSTPPAR